VNGTVSSQGIENNTAATPEVVSVAVKSGKDAGREGGGVGV